MVNYCNIALNGLHYSSTAETPTEGGDPTTAVVIAVFVSEIILVAVVIAIIIIHVVTCCQKTRVRRDYDTGSRAHVREVYLYILCAVFVL